MKFKRLTRWAEDRSLDGAKFFAQRLDEMLFDYTLDSYKAPALNAPYLAKEALALIKDIEEGIIDYANLSHVLDELIWSVQNDKLAKSLLDSEIEYYTAIASESELPSLKLRLDVLERTINVGRYQDAVISELKEKIFLGKKQSIDSLTRVLIATLINLGLSKEYLYNLTQKTFFNDGPAIQDQSIVHAFFDAISPKIHTFDVLLIVSKNIEQVSESTPAFRLKLIDELTPNMAEVAEICHFSPLNGQRYVLASGIEAYDIYSARQRAIYNLDQLGDLLALFQHRSRLSWREEAVISQRCCTDETEWITPPKGPMEKVSDLRPDKAAKELNTLLKSFSAKGVSFRKFNRVADIHGICVNHNIVDNQLVNLWTALETLTPSYAGSSKIANVTSSALPFLMHAYVGRLVQQLMFDLLTWNKWKARSLLHKVPCDPKTPLIGKCLRLLCLDENQALRDELYEKLGDFHLLRYRAFRLSEAVSNKEKLRDLLSSHERKVAWQIRRIYRTRNLIVHSGRTPPPYINTLVENGHDYLDSIIFDFMRTSCGPYSATSLEQVFEIAKIQYQNFLRNLAGNDPLTSDNCDFLLGKKNISTKF